VDACKKVPDLNCGVQHLLLQVVDLKQEVPDLRSGGIPHNLAPAPNHLTRSNAVDSGIGPATYAPHPTPVPSHNHVWKVGGELRWDGLPSPCFSSSIHSLSTLIAPPDNISYFSSFPLNPARRLEKLL